MSQTSKLGIVDSLLANVQLAFAVADPTPPAITTQGGSLDGQLGDTILALAGVTGPLTHNLTASSVLALAQTADPAPTFVAHSTPHWVLGGHDSQLGGMEPAYDRAPSALPTPTTQTGLLGTALGNVVFGLDGVAGPRVFNLVAQSALAIAQATDPAPTFAAHIAPRWVLGGQDSYLGGVELAFAGADEPRPATGDLTGKLGTVNSLLGGVRLALGLEEGGGGATIVYGTATTAIALLSEAVVGIVRGRAVSDTLVLSDLASVGSVRAREVASDLSVTDSAVAAAVRPAAASDSLDLTDTALGAAVFAVVAESVADLTVTADTAAARTLAAADALALTDEAARAASITVAAESVMEPATAADASAVRAVAAESALDLAHEADNSGKTTWILAVESAISLASDVDVQTALGLNLVSTLDLMDVAALAAARMLSSESAISPATVAAAAAVRPLVATSPASLMDAATGRKFATRAVESAIGLGQTASVMVVRAVSAQSALEVTDAAAGGVWQSADLDVWDWLPIWDWAEVSVVRGVSASNLIALAQSEQTARPWYLSAESPVQTQTVVYDLATDKLVTQIDGLQDAASVARPLTAAVSQAIPLGQSASVVLVKPNAIEVSAESVLELLGEIRPNATGDTGNWLAISQTATVDKCKTTKSTLALTGQATAARSGPRGAASALDLHQAATFSIVFAGVRQQYHPFVGEGTPGAPTPPPVTVGPPEHTALPFRLFYPASGTVTDSVTLRAPNLGNKDRLSFNRILRETRGGTLVVFADPIWPKIQTLVLTFSGLSATQSQQLLSFLETHLGEEIGLLDWEGRCWKGVVMTPTDPVVQDDRNSFSASMEFEGELVPA